MYIENGLIWVKNTEDGDGEKAKQQLPLLASTKKLMELMRVTPETLGSSDDVDALAETVEAVTLDESNNDSDNEDTVESTENNKNGQDTTAAAASANGAKAEKDQAQDSKGSKKKSKKKKDKTLFPQNIPFQKLVRVSNLGDKMEVCLEDIRRHKQRDYAAVKKDRSGGRGNHSHSRTEQRLVALEHKRRRLQQHLSDVADDAAASPEDATEDAWLRLVRYLNSIRVATLLLAPMLLHERRDDGELQIGTVQLVSKKHPVCWLLGTRVFDTFSGKMCKKSYRLLNELYSYLGLAQDYKVTMESNLWSETLDKLMQGVLKQHTSSSDVQLSWTDQDPLASFGAKHATTLLKVTAELDAMFLVDTTGEDPEQHARYLQSVKKLHDRLSTLLKRKYPTARLSIYGSCLSDLSLGKSSDVDLSLSLERAVEVQKSFESGDWPVHQYEKEMKRLVYDVCRKFQGMPREFGEMTPVAFARVPVVKGRYLMADNPHADDGSLHFDICFLNDIAVANSGLIREYSLVHVKVKQLMIAVKKWAKANHINSAQDNSLSSYAWMNMVIFYLQCAGVVPNLQNPALMEKAGLVRDLKNEWHVVNNLDTCYLTWEQAKPVWKPSGKTDQSSAALLYGFFGFYAYDFPCSLYAVSIKYGRERLLPKTSFQKCPPFLSIEDPFETFDSHCPHDLGTPAADAGGNNLVRCLQEAEWHYREILLSVTGKDANVAGVKSLWPASPEQKAPAGESNGGRNGRKRNNGNNGRGNQQNGRNGNGRELYQPNQKQPSNLRARHDDDWRARHEVKAKNVEKVQGRKANNTDNKKQGSADDTKLAHTDNKGDVGQDRPSGNDQEDKPRKKKPKKKKKNTGSQQVVVVTNNNGVTNVEHINANEIAAGAQTSEPSGNSRGGHNRGRGGGRGNRGGYGRGGGGDRSGGRSSPKNSESNG